MKIGKLKDLFDISFKKIRQKELLDFFKLCIKYRSQLFDEDFFKINFLTPQRFFNFIQKFKDHIYFILLENEHKFAGFFYLYETKQTPRGFFDCKVTFCISRPYWGFGSYVIAKRGIKFLFEQMMVRKLTVEIVGENTYARRLIEKLDFNFEAVLQKECFKNGTAQNLYLFTKFNPAF